MLQAVPEWWLVKSERSYKHIPSTLVKPQNFYTYHYAYTPNMYWTRYNINDYTCRLTAIWKKDLGKMAKISACMVQSTYNLKFIWLLVHTFLSSSVCWWVTTGWNLLSTLFIYTTLFRSADEPHCREAKPLKRNQAYLYPFCWKWEGSEK